MRKKIRGTAAVMLAAAMTMTTLGGCAKTDSRTPAETTRGAADDTGTTDGADTAADAAEADTKEAEGSTDAATEKNGKETVGAQAVSAGDVAMGRYMETEISLPEGMMQRCQVKAFEDGRLLVLGQTEEPGLWESTDGGETWEKVYPWAKEYIGAYLSCGAIGDDGSVFAVISLEDGGHLYVKADPEGNFTEVAPQIEALSEKILEDTMNSIYWVQYAEEGKWLVKTVVGDMIYLIDDTSGEVVRTYNEEEAFVGFWYKLDDRIFTAGNEEILCFDYETGEEAELDAVLKEELEGRKENLNITNTIAYPLLVCQGGDGAYYYCNEEGIYRYEAGGSVIEQLADGSLNSLSKPSLQLTDMQVLSDGTIFVMAMDDSMAKVLRYTYDPEVPTVPDTELRVYTLQESTELQQAISMFQTANPSYYVKLEVGMTGEDAVTTSDALRTLNTELMAGNGPDILILDGMPLGSYMEKGILEDLSDIVAKVESGDGIYENIAKTYEQDGTLYAVPTRFQIPIIEAEQEILDQIGSLAELTETAQKLREEDEDVRMIVNVSNIYWLMHELYSAYSTELLKEDGSIDREKMTDFIADAKQIFELNHYEEEYLDFYYTSTNDEDFDFSTNSAMYEFLTDQIRIDQSNLADPLGLAQLCGVLERKDLSYKTVPVAGKNIFVPGLIVGVSSRSAQIEGAKGFVSFLLSEKAQESGRGNGWPVNRAAMEANLADKNSMEMTSSWTTMDEDGNFEDVEFDVTAPSEEEMTRFVELAESLDTPCLTDAVMKELVFEQAGKCISGEIPVEEAVNAIEQKMNLYLAE